MQPSGHRRPQLFRQRVSKRVRHGHEAFEANRPITENLTAINSGPILAAMNTVTNYVGQDIITASNLNRMVPAMMSYDNTRAREEEEEEEGKSGGGNGTA